jgi:hypothetical protein
VPDLTEPALGRLIAGLPPAPEAWVAAAQQLPAARRAIDTLAERACVDIQDRRMILRDLESALEAQGVKPRDELVQELRSRLSEPREGANAVMGCWPAAPIRLTALSRATKVASGMTGMSCSQVLLGLLVCHVVGDVRLQTDWQAVSKLGGALLQGLWPRAAFTLCLPVGSSSRAGTDHGAARGGGRVLGGEPASGDRRR